MPLWSWTDRRLPKETCSSSWADPASSASRSRPGSPARTRQDFSDRCPASGPAVPVRRTPRSGFAARSIEFVRDRHVVASVPSCHAESVSPAPRQRPRSRRCIARASLQGGRSRAVPSSLRAASADRGKEETRTPSGRFGRKRTSGISRDLLAARAPRTAAFRKALVSSPTRRTDRAAACVRRPSFPSRCARGVTVGTVRARSRCSSVRRRTR